MTTHSTFRPSAQLRHRGQFLTASRNAFRASLPLARRLLVRDLRSRYRMSVLGYAWMVLPAIAQTAVWLLLNKSQILNSGVTSIPLPLYILVGTLLWQGFVDGLMAPGTQLANAANVLTKVSFPAEALLLSGLADAATSMVIRLTLIVPVLLYYRVVPGWGLLLAPVGMLSLLLLGFAIGLALAPFGMLYQDIPRILALAIPFWLLITPVAYSAPVAGPATALLKVNPVSPALIATRDWMTGGALFPGYRMEVFLVATLVLLAASWVVFRVSVPHLVDRVGS